MIKPPIDALFAAVRVIVLILFPALSCVFAPTSLHAQCPIGWLPGDPAPGLNSSVLSTTTWDPDGDGPALPQLIAAGFFSTADGVTVNRIARWDGTAWRSFGSGVNGSRVYAVTTWDQDGSGPQAPQLIAGGVFQVGANGFNIARWDGLAWQPIGSQLSGSAVYALTSWDPDDAGPILPRLVAFGEFTVAGSSRIASWDGTMWSPLGVGLSGGFFSGLKPAALATWDPDGSGPLTSQLVAAGYFTTAGGQPANRVARWDGTTWQPFGSGFNGPLYSLATFDPDGDGPAFAQVVAGGTFATSGGTTVNNVARWDGSTWLPFGSGLPSSGPPGGVNALALWDPDGDGAMPTQLVAAGNSTVFSFGSYAARWDGSSWQSIGTGFDGFPYTLTTWDQDGAGPMSPSLVVGGRYSTADGLGANYIAAHSTDASSNWAAIQAPPVGSALSNRVLASTMWDPDGPGPLPRQVVVGGSFTSIGSTPFNRIARWDGSMWHPFGTGMNGSISALAAWDPDGSGPLPEHLIAAGSFSTAGGTPVSSIARWDGSTWHPLGTGLAGFAHGLTTWDPDGAGPNLPLIVAVGCFVSAGGVTVNNVARWDGINWQAFGTGPGAVNCVFSITTWDPDGSGSLTPRVVIGSDTRVQEWTGTNWLELGSNFSQSGVSSRIGSIGGFFAITTWDADGDAATPRSLVVGGSFPSINNVTASHIARWDGTVWLPISTGFGGGSNQFTVEALTTWDPDGAGSASEQLIAGGLFDVAGNSVVNNLARYDGTAWRAFEGGVNNSVFSLTVGDPDGTGFAGDQLFVGGAFTMTGMEQSSYFSAYALDAVDRAIIAPDYSCNRTIFGGSGTQQSNQIVSGDLNRDGKLDLIASASGGASAVWLFFGNGNGTFQPLRSTFVNSSPRGIVVADFDADGNPDIAVANSVSAGTVSITFGAGDGTFTYSPPISVGAFPTYLVTDDFNCDGLPDLAVANGGTQPSSASVIINIGDGTFAPAVSYPILTGAVLRWVVSDDFNNDASPDLAFVFQNFGGVSVLLGRPDGTFGPSIRTNGTSFTTGRCASGDFNRDGNPDLAIANQGGSEVRVFFGTGFGTFTRTVTTSALIVPVGQGPTGVIAVDFNSDCATDLVVTNQTINSVSFLVGVGDGTFTHRLDVPLNAPPGDGAPVALVAGEFDFGRTLDIAVLNSARSSVSMLRGPLASDFNHDTFVNSQDFFDFIAAFFSLQPAADFNSDAFINSQDFFDFVAAFFAGC